MLAAQLCLESASDFSISFIRFSIATSTGDMLIESDPFFSPFPGGIAMTGICRVELEEVGSRNFHMSGDGFTIPRSPYIVLMEEA